MSGQFVGPAGSEAASLAGSESVAANSDPRDQPVSRERSALVCSNSL